MDKPSLRERALRCLARRDYSRAELARKLAPYGTEEEIGAILDRMGELSLQSDERMAQNWVRSHAGRFGQTRMRHELARRGVPRDLIEGALSDESLEGESERARAVWQSRFSAGPQDAREWARQARFLLARGFESEVVRAVLRSAPETLEDRTL